MGKLGGYLGAIFGICGWLIGLTAVCLFTGHTAALRPIFLPGLAVSLSMGFTLVIALECVLRLYGRGHYMFSTTLWGLLLFDVGLLMLLLNHWIAPMIDASPGLAEDLRRIRSTYRTGDTLPLAGLCAGAALLACVALKVVGDALRRPDDPPKERP